MANYKLYRIMVVLMMVIWIPVNIIYVAHVVYKEECNIPGKSKDSVKILLDKAEHKTGAITVQGSNSSETFKTHKVPITERGSVFEHWNKVISDGVYSQHPPLKLDEVKFETDLNVNIDRKYIFGPPQYRIPRIIHFMWKTEIIPSVFVENLKTFVKHNPTWTYYFWTDISCANFIKEKYPKLLQTYSSYGNNVSRSDAARYVIMYHFGGAYFDLDTINFKPLDPLLETDECIVTPEPMEHAIVVLKMRSLLGNCVFLCRPRHGFFHHVLSELHKTIRLKLVESAGPVFFTNAFNSYINNCFQRRYNDSIHVMSSEYFLDKVKDDVHMVLNVRCRFYTKDEGPSMNMSETCKLWRLRGAEKRNVSEKAFSLHLYFGTYNDGFGDQLDMLQENNIRNILPGVRIYPDQ